MVTRFPVVSLLVVLNVGWFVQALLLPDDALLMLELWPLGTDQFRPWQLLTYLQLHGSLMHLAFNMLALVMFGASLESAWGGRRFLAAYLVCGIGAGIVQLLAGWVGSTYLGADQVVTVGASGAVFGLVAAVGLQFPRWRVMLLFPPVPMRAATLAILLVLLELLLAVSGVQDGVAHYAHLGGLACGAMLAWRWRSAAVRVTP